MTQSLLKWHARSSRKASEVCTPAKWPIKAGFHQRRSRSRSRNQKGRAIRSSENQTDNDSAYVSVAYDQVKTALSESQAEAEE